MRDKRKKGRKKKLPRGLAEMRRVA